MSQPLQYVLCRFCGLEFPALAGMLGLVLEGHVRDIHKPREISCSTATGWMIKDGVFEVIR